MALAKTKYKERKPKIAKTFDVYIKKGLVVIENIAGSESTAKIISEISIRINAKRNWFRIIMHLCFLENVYN